MTSTGRARHRLDIGPGAAAMADVGAPEEIVAVEVAERSEVLAEPAGAADWLGIVAGTDTVTPSMPADDIALWPAVAEVELASDGPALAEAETPVAHQEVAAPSVSDPEPSAVSWLSSIEFAPEAPELSVEAPVAELGPVVDQASPVHIHHHYEAPSPARAPSEPAAGAAVIYEPEPDLDPRYDHNFVAPPETPARTPRPDPGPIAPKVKAPLFVWRGKPVGGTAPAAIGVLPARAERSMRQAPQADRDPGDVDGSGIDPQTWFDNTMQLALDMGASDLHIGVEDDNNGSSTLTARVRIDGQMRLHEIIYGMDARVIIGKFKAAADLATGGSFVPEESIYEVEVEGEIRKARVALFRTANGGDALVLRLPPTGPLRELSELEIAPKNLELFHDLLASANRMILIAGPMGSGKTTTAHAALMHVATPNRTVWSVEDPVERVLPGLTQLEVDEKNGAGFAALLPVLVRSDYDTLFLGEIRDKSTAAAGVRQAKAGRQVVTTIHANDNVTSLLRLIELSEDSPLSVMDAVLGVVSQRLVRKLNPEWDGVDPEGKYRGRVPVHEVLRVNDELTEAVMRDKPIAEIKRIAAESSETTFQMDAERLVAEGITDWEEIHRVLGH